MTKEALPKTAVSWNVVKTDEPEALLNFYKKQRKEVQAKQASHKRLILYGSGTKKSKTPQVNVIQTTNTKPTPGEDSVSKKLNDLIMSRFQDNRLALNRIHGAKEGPPTTPHPKPADPSIKTTE